MDGDTNADVTGRMHYDHANTDSYADPKGHRDGHARTNLHEHCDQPASSHRYANTCRARR